MATKMTRTNFVELLYRGLHKIFFDNYAKPTAEYPMVFNTMSWDEYSYKAGRMMGLGPFHPKAEGSYIDMDAAKWLSDKEIFFPTWALGFGITWEMLEDDLYGQIDKLAKELGDKAHLTKELLSWDILNGAALTGEVGLDSKALLANDHVTGDGVTTLDNLSAASLSLTAIEAGLTYFEKMVNERSEPIPFTGPKLLIIPPELKYKAKELLLTEYKPEFNVDTDGTTLDTRNAINAIGDEDISYMVCHYLTKSDAWFMVDKTNHDLSGVTRRETSFDNTKDPKTTDAIYYSTFRYKASFFDFRGVYGFPGT